MAYQGNRRHESFDDHQQQPRTRFNKNEFQRQQQAAQPASSETFGEDQPAIQQREERPRQPRNEQPREKKFHADAVALHDFEEQLRNTTWVIDIDLETGSFHQVAMAHKAQTDLYYTAYRNGSRHMEAWFKHQTRALNEKVRAAAREAAKKEHERCQAELTTGDAEFDEFARQVRGHDWYYQYSDDGAVFRRGADNHERLEAIAKIKGGIYQKYWEYYPTTMNKKEG